jgi:hypothetical protein
VLVKLIFLVAVKESENYCNTCNHCPLTFSCSVELPIFIVVTSHSGRFRDALLHTEEFVIKWLNCKRKLSILWYRLSFKHLYLCREANGHGKLVII